MPEVDEQIDEPPGSPRYFIKHRPVFLADAIDGKISPNLAGRLAAAFALGYQVFKNDDPAYAKKLLAAAEQIFDLAATTNITSLTTAYAHEFYPEDEWRDDLEWGAVELHIASADEKNSAEAARYLQLAAHWAHEYIAAGQQDSLNLYDVSGLAHYELCRALDRAGAVAGLEMSRAGLVANLKRRLDSAVKRADKDPFALGFRYTGGDLVPHVIGLALEADFYDDLTHTTTYADFSRRQMDFVLGANAWGTSFIVGAGKVFPFHMQHQIANLYGSLDGTPPLLLGATVDGPSRGKSKAGDVPDGARPTPWPGGKDPFAPFNGNKVQHTDDVGSWATVEPANDYTIPTALIFARRASR
jgi:endoglucanase